MKEFGKMTEKDLGIAVEFPPKSATVRIAQYESCSVLQKKDTAIAMSKALNCNHIIYIYYEEDLWRTERFIFDLFWMEEAAANSLYVFQLEKYIDNDDNRVICRKYNEFNFYSTFPSVALTFNYSLINDFMREWVYHFNERKKSIS